MLDTVEKVKADKIAQVVAQQNIIKLCWKEDDAQRYATTRLSINMEEKMIEDVPYWQ